MTSIWAESVAATLDDALITLALAVGVCEGDVWETSMWDVPAGHPGDAARTLDGPDGAPVTDPAERLALVQRFSAPWSVSWHALEVLDYDLTGDLTPWAGPPAPFADHPHWRDFTSLPGPWTTSEVIDYYLTGRLSPWAGPPEPFRDHPHWRDFTSLPRPWQQAEVLDYIEHCRQRVRDTFDGLTDERASTPCTAFRRPGTPYARILVDLVAHTNEHAAQILQHVNAVSRH